MTAIPAKPPAAPAPAATPPKAPAAPAAAAGTPPASPAASPEPKPAAAAGAAPAAAPAKAKPAAGKPPANVPKLGDAPVDDADAAPVPALGDAPEPDAVEGDEPAAEAEATEEPKEGDEAEKGETEDGEQPATEIDLGEAPEGQAPYRAPVIDAYKAVLKEHKVTAEVGKAILDAMLPVIRADADAQVKAHIEQTTAEWNAALEQRHGRKLGQVRNLANRALERAATPELRDFLRDSALAVNPDFNDMLAFFGQRLTNDRAVKASDRSAPKVDKSAVDEAADEYRESERKAAQAAQRGQ